jgi:hypothetical protein
MEILKMNLEQFKEAINKYTPFMHCVLEKYFSFTPNVTKTCDIEFNSSGKIIYFPKYETIKINKFGQIYSSSTRWSDSDIVSTENDEEIVKKLKRITTKVKNLKIKYKKKQMEKDFEELK